MEYSITGKATPTVKEDRVLNEDVETIRQIVKRGTKQNPEGTLRISCHTSFYTLFDKPPKDVEDRVVENECSYGIKLLGNL